VAPSAPTVPAQELLERDPASLEARRPDIRERAAHGHHADGRELLRQAKAVSDIDRDVGGVVRNFLALLRGPPL